MIKLVYKAGNKLDYFYSFYKEGFMKTSCGRFDGWQCLYDEERYYISINLLFSQTICGDRSIVIKDYNVKSFSKIIKDCI